MFVPLGPINGIWPDVRDSTFYFGLVFSEPLDLSGLFFQVTWRTYPDVSGGSLQWASVPGDFRFSPNTTNLVDGDWSRDRGTFDSVPLISTYVSPVNSSGVHAITGALSPVQHTDTKSVYRSRKALLSAGQESVSLSGIRGIKIGVSPYVGYYGSYDANDRAVIRLHLYGRLSEYSSFNHLTLWHPTQDMRVSPGYLRFDEYRPSTGSKQFRIKNLSSSAADRISVSAEDEWLAPSPSPASSIQFSLDGSGWDSVVVLPYLSPGMVSSVVHVRHVTPANAPLGSHSARINFDPEGWV